MSKGFRDKSGKAQHKAPVTHVLQFRIELLDSNPLIWRRIQVPDHYMFWDLHVAIQNALGWNDSHLHEFRLTTEDGCTRCFGLPIDEEHWRDAVHRPLPDWEHRVVDFLQSSGYRIE